MRKDCATISQTQSGHGASLITVSARLHKKPGHSFARLRAHNNHVDAVIRTKLTIPDAVRGNVVPSPPNSRLFAPQRRFPKRFSCSASVSSPPAYLKRQLRSYLLLEHSYCAVQVGILTRRGRSEQDLRRDVPLFPLRSLIPNALRPTVHACTWR